MDIEGPFATKNLVPTIWAVAIAAAGGALAGEVKGPPGTPNNINETAAPTHATRVSASP